VGSQATSAEHCDCSRALLVLPGETIDDAVARVGKLPEAEWRRLACGSQIPQQTLRMLRTLTEVSPMERVIRRKTWLGALLT
jgi:hypothetical protein